MRNAATWLIRGSVARRRWVFSRLGTLCAAASDMAGNVWEWTSSLWGKDYSKPEFGYPYDPRDGRENQNAPDTVLRTFRGSWYGNGRGACAAPAVSGSIPDNRDDNNGFRVVSPGF